ncbi:uncharacterized protein LOC131690812 [Topomyia yanbarensis]|uniref:uncharacterized protein LOC131690812 n=1 Tax=Topomyia yanbarensis TaxID=2498891 RepID=UPI00273AEEAB|nr:uncharacterized protein LOC131690812 [Topomyia yanbarensis]
MDHIWQNITTALEVPSDVADKWLIKLKKQYSLPNRYYHSEKQMIHKKAEHLSGASVCLQLASLFQYYHFDAGKDSVRENCDVLKEFLVDAKLDNKTLENNILQLLGDVSVESVDLPEDDVLYFQDLDLLILGYSPEEYKQYTVQLRQEYSAIDTESYNKMRLKILQTFNRIPFIYATKAFSEKYESAARANIENEIKELENQ